MRNLVLAAATGLALSLTVAPSFAQGHHSGSSAASQSQAADPASSSNNGNNGSNGSGTNCASVEAQHSRFGSGDTRGCF